MSTLENVSLTHSGADKLSFEEVESELKQIKDRLAIEFKDNAYKLQKLLQLTDELAEFELGRFIIKNKSLSGYWTWYVIEGFKQYSITSPLEKLMLESRAFFFPTRERFGIFQSLLSNHIQSNNLVCSVPCGMMADLLTLKLPAEISGVRYVGIDADVAVFDLAKEWAKKLDVQVPCEFIQSDAWHLNIENQFDLMTTNGLNIYEKDDNRVVDLYREMYHALKNKGYLICATLTLPPIMGSDSEWDISKMDSHELAISTDVIRIILQPKWTNCRSSTKTREQLREAGFDKVEIFWDSQRINPTFLARKI